MRPIGPARSAIAPLVELAEIADFPGQSRLDNQSCDRLEPVLRELAARRPSHDDLARQQK
jgi:hypothetical protein